jgi:transcriptional regulator with XRE-family HTH domain
MNHEKPLAYFSEERRGKNMIRTNGQKIRVARERKGLTLAQLAEQVGKTAPYISDIERGNRRGSYETLERIAEVLGLKVDEIREVA